MRKRSDVVDTLRQRVISARHFGTLPPDGRLPSARALAGELQADPRVVFAAFRALEREGLVEQRPPSRAFFVVRWDSSGASHTSKRSGAAPHGLVAPTRGDAWLVDVLSQVLERDVALPDFPEHVRRAIETVRLRAACIECNTDQQVWLCRELGEDYGIESVAIEVDTVAALVGSDSADDWPYADVTPPDAGTLPPELRRADVLLTTAAHAPLVQALAERTRKPCVIVTQRADLTRELEQLLARAPVYFLGTDPRFAHKLRALLAAWANPERVRPVILGVDDPGAIPPGSPTYVMRTARDRLGGVPLHVRVLSTRRVFSTETRAQLLRFGVEANLRAAAAMAQPA